MRFKMFLFFSIFTFINFANAEDKVNLKLIDFKEVNVCDDIDEWPPYTFYKRTNKRVTSEIVGFSVDLVV